MGRRRANHSPAGRPQRRRRRVVIVGVVLALLGWILAVAALGGGGGSEQGGSPGDDGHGLGEATDPSPGPESATDDGDEPASSSSVPAEDGSNKDDEEHVHSYTNETTTLPPGEAAKLNEPSNPLLLDDPTLSDLSETDRARIEQAAARFVTAAYGYSGDSEQEYRQGVSDTSHAIDLYSSPGGELIDQEYAEAIGEEGIHSAARLQEFEVTSVKNSQAKATAHFTISSGGEYNRYGELEGGESIDYRQELMLYPYGEVYRVTSASVEKPVTEQFSQQDEEKEGRQS